MAQADWSNKLQALVFGELYLAFGMACLAFGIMYLEFETEYFAFRFVYWITCEYTLFTCDCDGAAERLLAAQAAWSNIQPAAGFSLNQSQHSKLLKCSPLLSPSDINAFKISVKRLLAIFLQPTLPDTHGQLHPDVHLTVPLPRWDAPATPLTASLEAGAASAPARLASQLQAADSRPVLGSCWRGFQNAPRRRPASPSWLVVPFFAPAPRSSPSFPSVSGRWTFPLN